MASSTEQIDWLLWLMIHREQVLIDAVVVELLQWKMSGAGKGFCIDLCMGAHIQHSGFLQLLKCIRGNTGDSHIDSLLKIRGSKWISVP